MTETSAQGTWSPFLQKVRIRNYKSIGHCGVELSPLTVLIGRNGSGKSNFLDALRFVANGLRTTVDNALRAHGGLSQVRRISTGHPRNFSIGLEFSLPDWVMVAYEFEIAASKSEGFVIKEERLRQSRGEKVLGHYLRRDDDLVECSEAQMPPVAGDRLYLVNAAGVPAFRAAYDALRAMGFYNLNPEAMKELQSPDPGELLRGDGSNIASVVARLEAQQPRTLERIREYLTSIVPGITRIDRKALGPRETLRFYQEIEGAEHPWKFYASSMSDGTLRALGAIVAVAQLADQEQPVPLVGIEEPETALHPAAAGALMDALREASAHTQVLLTSHSTDLLDQVDLSQDGLLVVVSRGGTTSIAPVDPASLEALRDHLFTPGELLRMDQLEPDTKHLERQDQLDLFEVPERAEAS